MKNNTKPTIYIFPGFEETTKRRPYQELKRILTSKGYKVILKNINWQEEFSKQIFDLEEDSILIGFSLGAVMAKLLAEKNKSKHSPAKVILASMTQMKYFKNKKDIALLIEVWNKDFVLDIVQNLKTKGKLSREVMLCGDKEEEFGDIVVKDTGHELTSNYLLAITKVVTDKKS